MKKFLRSQKGFTLIELLVVIAILGAIAGVVVLNIGSFIGRGKCEAYATEKHNIVTACIASLTENGTEANYADYLLTDAAYTWTVATDGGCDIADASDAPTCP